MTWRNRFSFLFVALTACSGTITVGSLVCIDDGGAACVNASANAASTVTHGQRGNAASTVTLPVDAGDDTTGDCAIAVDPVRIDLVAYPQAEHVGADRFQVANVGTTCSVTVQVGPPYDGQRLASPQAGFSDWVDSLAFVLPPGAVRQVEFFGSEFGPSWSKVPITACPGCASISVVVTRAPAVTWFDGGGVTACQAAGMQSLTWTQATGGAVSATVGDSLVLPIADAVNDLRLTQDYFPAWQAGLQSGPFSILSPELPYGLPIAMEEQIGLFQPTEGGTFVETFTDPVSGCTMTVQGTGVLPDAGSGCYLITDQAFLGFDSVPAGGSLTKTLTLTNVGDQTCEVNPYFNPILGLGVWADSFDVTVPSCAGNSSPACAINPDAGVLSGPFEIPPSSGWQVQVTFHSLIDSPNGLTNYGGLFTPFYLEIGSNDAVAPGRSILVYATSK